MSGGLLGKTRAGRANGAKVEGCLPKPRAVFKAGYSGKTGPRARVARIADRLRNRAQFFGNDGSEGLNV
jgi:hypothetical protein